MPTNVQYGCGLCAPADWINFDSSPTLRMQRIPVVGRFTPGVRFPTNVRYGDIVKGLPINDASADLVYCSHVLEHLPLDNFRAALRNTLRIMRPGAVFRLVVPDLRHHAEKYVASTNERAAIDFIGGMDLGMRHRPTRPIQILRARFGSGSAHLWMWDGPALIAELRDAGFTNIRLAHYCDSGIPAFRSVEDEGRWAIGAVGIHCTR